MEKLQTKIVIALTAFVFLCVMITGAMAEEKGAIKGGIATVNGKPIAQKDYDREMKKINMRYEKTGQQIPAEEKKKIESAIVDDLITREVLFQESEKQGIKVDGKEVDQQYNMILERYPDKKKFQELLTQWNFTEDEIKSEIERSTAVQKLIKTTVADKITVADNDIKKFYDDNPEKFKSPEEVKASHILVKFDPKTADKAQKEAAKKKIEAVKERLKKGEDFAAVAKEISDCPSKKNGGDLGFITKGQMVKPFEDATFALKKDEMSDIVETQFGYHIIKVFDKKPAKVVEFKEVKDRLAEQLKQQKTQEQAVAYIQKLRGSAKIERKDGASQPN